MKKRLRVLILSMVGVYLGAIAHQAEAGTEPLGSYRLIVALERSFNFGNGVDRYQLVFQNLSTRKSFKYVQFFVAPHQGQPVILGLGLSQTQFIDEHREAIKSTLESGSARVSGSISEPDYIFNFSDDYRLGEASLNALVNYDPEALKAAYLKNQALSGSTHFVDFTDLFKTFRPNSVQRAVDTSQVIVPISFMGESPAPYTECKSEQVKELSALFGTQIPTDSAIQKSNAEIFAQVFKNYEIKQPILEAVQRDNE